MYVRQSVSALGQCGGVGRCDWMGLRAHPSASFTRHLTPHVTNHHHPPQDDEAAVRQRQQEQEAGQGAEEEDPDRAKARVLWEMARRKKPAKVRV